MEESINNQSSTNGTDKHKAEALKQQIGKLQSSLERSFNLSDLKSIIMTDHCFH